MKHRSDSFTLHRTVGPKSGTASRSWFWLLLGVVLFAVASSRAETNVIRRQILLPDGRPAVGAKIHGMVLSRDEQRREIRMVADAVGKFTADFDLQGYDEGCLTIDATNCALFVLRLYGRSWMQPTNQVENLFPTVQLKPAYPVAGRVVDENNRAVMGARMATIGFHPHTYTPLWLRDSNAEAWPELGAVSGADGHFVLRGIDLEDFYHLPNLQVALAATAPGTGGILSGEAIFTHHRTDGDGLVTNPVVILRQSISIQGRVVNPLTRSPVEGAGISVSGTSAFRFQPVQTGKDGRFLFRDVPSYARLQLSVTGSNYAAVRVFRPDAIRGEMQKPVENLEVRLRPLVTVSGKIIDADAGGEPIMPVELTVTKEESLSQGLVQSSAGTYSIGQGNEPAHGIFSVQVPAGPVAFHIAADSSRGAYRKAYDHQLVVEVPEQGQTGLLLKVPRRPGVLVQLESTEPGKLLWNGYGGNLIINVREEQSNGISYADYTPLWFFPVSAWGKKMEVNMVRRISRTDGSSEDREILPWTGIVADPKTWPVRLKVP